MQYSLASKRPTFTVLECAHRSDMEAKLEEVRREMSSLQTDEQKKLDQERQTVVSRIRDQVSLTPHHLCC